MAWAAMTALALVAFTLGAYLGLARKVMWPSAAVSMPRTAVISISPLPSRRHPRAWASSVSCIGVCKEQG